MTAPAPRPALVRIECPRVRNHRVLRDLALNEITPLTVFTEPNGSGRSTGPPRPARVMESGVGYLAGSPVPLRLSIEEPENHLHPRLLVELAEECRAASERSQVFVSTHSPYLVNGIRPPGAQGLVPRC